MTAATPISTALTDAAEPCSPFSIPPPRSAPTSSARGGHPPARRRTSSRQESRFLHEHDVPRFLARHPGFVFLSAQGRLVERPRFEEARPVGRRTHLLQQVHVVLD